MNCLKHITGCGLFALLLAIAQSSTDAQQTSSLRLFEWERGVGFESPADPEMKVYLWFYEWNMFEAREEGQHTGGTYHWPRNFEADGRRADLGTEDLRLGVVARDGSADLSLSVTNRTDHDWPELAGIIPCFNPGPPEARNRQLAHTNTYFVGPNGLERLIKREIHFFDKLRPSLERISPDGQFVFSHKWPTSDTNATEGLIIRESTDGKWVAGIAWESFLSAQGHNPWECMHLCARVGPLKRNEKRTIRGKVYLFEGTKEDCLRRYRADFEKR